MRLSFLVAFAPLIATPALAVQGAPAKVDAMAKPDQKICRKTALIGSLIPTKRECHTRAEWGALARDGNDAVRAEADRNRPAGNAGPPG